MYREVTNDPVMWPYYVFGGCVVLIIFALLVYTIQTIFDRLSPDLRTLRAPQLWLTIIPVFGSFWIFYVVYQLAHSLREEFKRRSIIEFETSPGLGTGWAFSFVAFTAQLMLTIDEPVVTSLLSILAVILLVVYWTKIVSFRAKLDEDIARTSTQQMPPYGFQQTHYPPSPYYPPPPPPPSSPPPADDQWERWRPK